MSVEDGKDARYMLWYAREHLAIKDKRRALKFQCSVYGNALTKEKRTYKRLLEGQERRKASYNPMFSTIEELDKAYEEGGMDNKEYMSQRSKIWQVYSDRGHVKNIEWLEHELAVCQGQLDALEAKMEELSKASQRYKAHGRNVRRHKTNYERKRRRNIRKKELEERWKKYGIG